ncbi:MAG: type I restriction enzyme HsdR N-terminal domain-containing protein [Chloroflexi bacterium]|nr:type I restriction enzyme HsdR N-terminal domain-containing protein [Chloroflexota bacterium]
MWLDELKQLISTLDAKADTYVQHLGNNEALTRSVLIDPLLNYLGWDLSDPGQVVVEYNAGGGRADYALFGDDKTTPTLIIEAKSLGTSLEPVIKQALYYSNQSGVKYCAVTDGRKWFVYDVFRQARIEDRVVVQFDLRMDEHHKCVMQSLWFWRGNFSGSSEPVTAQLNTHRARARITAPTESTAMQQHSVQIKDGWKPMLDVLGRLKLSTKDNRMQPPTRIKFPDGSEKPILSWRDVQARTALWGIEIGYITKTTCPVVSPQGTHLVNTKPIRKNGKAFTAALKVANFWIEAHASAKDHTRLALAIMDSIGQDPSTAELLLS